MKKIRYNKNEKEIDAIEKEGFSETGKDNEKKTKLDKAWLEKNRIFFEVFSYVFVGIMGIVISYVGWKTNERSADIYQKQLEIMKNDREPYFKIKSEEIYEETEKTEDNETIAIKRYTIFNEGGVIRDVSIQKDACAIIYIQKDKDVIGEYNIFKYTFLDFFFNAPDSVITQHMEDDDDIVFYEYGIERKHPEYIDEEEFDYEDIFWMLEEELRKYFKCDIILYRKNFVEITYTNYKNEKYTKRFEFTDDNMWLSNKDEEGIDLYYNVSTEVNEMAKEIQDRAENWIIENK